MPIKAYGAPLRIGRRGSIVADPLRNGASPFLRWAGSKRWLVPLLKEIAPEGFGSYYEPFIGSGAVFFALARGHESHLSDTLLPLVNCYQQVQLNPGAVAQIAQSWDTDRETFYTIRGKAYDDPIHAAAQFIYLNKLCFNGLYRVNQRGIFNVPYGRPKSTNIVSESQLISASQSLASATITDADFEEALSQCSRGDLVYLDPPYVAGHRSNGFADYNAKIFSWDDQRRLAEAFRELSSRGVQVILSNADHPTVRDLYDGFFTKSIERYSSMSARSRHRGNSAEVLVLSRALSGYGAR